MIAWLNSIISALGRGLTLILSLLPPSPFNFTYTVDNNMIKIMNYLFPFSQAVAHLETYLSAVVLYYAIRIALKWIKAAGN